MDDDLSRNERKKEIYSHEIYFSLKFTQVKKQMLGARYIHTMLHHSREIWNIIADTTFTSRRYFEYIQLFRN